MKQQNCFVMLHYELYLKKSGYIFNLIFFWLIFNPKMVLKVIIVYYYYYYYY